MSELDQIKMKFADDFRNRINDALEVLLFSMYDVEKAGGRSNDLMELMVIASNITSEKLLSSLKFEG